MPKCCLKSSVLRFDLKAKREVEFLVLVEREFQIIGEAFEKDLSKNLFFVTGRNSSKEREERRFRDGVFLVMRD